MILIEIHLNKKEKLKYVGYFAKVCIVYARIEAIGQLGYIEREARSQIRVGDFFNRHTY